MRARVPHFFPLVAIVLAAILATLAGLGSQRTLDGFQPLGFTAVRDGGSWRIVDVDDASTGLEIGDRLILGTESTGPGPLRDQLTAEPSSNLQVLRDDAIVDVLYERPPFDLDPVWVVLVVIGAAYLLIGLYTGVRDPHPAARLFFFWSQSAAALFALRPTLLPRDGLDVAIFLVDQGARSLLPALTLHLFLVFPTPLFSKALRRGLLALVWAPALASIAFHLDQALYSGRWTGIAAPTFLERLDRWELLAIVGASLIGALLLALRLRRDEDWETRRQSQWIVVGLFGGYLPFLALYAGPLALGLQLPSWTHVLAVLPLGLVPLAFAWALLKYKLFDLGVIVKDSVSWTLTVFLGLLGFSLLDLGLERALEQNLVLVRNLVTFAAGIGLASVLVPTRRAIRTGLERIQYRRGLGSRRALVDLGRDLLAEHDLDEVCSTVLETLREALGVSRIALLLVDEEDRLAAYPDPQIGARLAPIPRTELPDDLWGRETASLSSARLAEGRPSAERDLFQEGFRYALPLVVHDRPVGLAIFGYRGGLEPLDSDDLDLARGLLDHASLAIENARLLREVEARLHEVARLEEHNKGILDSSPAGIAVLDENDCVLSANRAFARIAETDDDLVGRRLEEVLPVMPVPEAEDGLVDVAWCEAEGRERHLQISVARYPRPGGVPLRVLVCHDTTDRMAMERLLQERERLASLGMLAAGVAHEVNTPLTGISSYAQMLLADTDPDDPAFAILKKMERQTFRASQIVNNLLDFSRSRRDEPRPVGLAAVVEESLDLLRERANDANVVLTTRAEDPDVLVLGHEGEIRQIVTNLVVNAIDALRSTPDARVEVRLETTEDRVRLLVDDNGPGIPPDRLETVFQPFFSSKLERGGTGLGLAITTDLVRRHRGRIHATNHVDGPGCTFEVDLPRHRSA